PKAVSTPQSSSFSTITSPVVLAISGPPRDRKGLICIETICRLPRAGVSQSGPSWARPREGAAERPTGAQIKTQVRNDWRIDFERAGRCAEKWQIIPSARDQQRRG